MPSERPLRRVQDILDNAEAILRYTAGMDLACFQQDSKTYDAVERCFERISEAVTKLGDQASILMPGQPWEKVRALGNRLRHEYDTIREDRLWVLCKPICPLFAGHAKRHCAGEESIER